VFKTKHLLKLHTINADRTTGGDIKTLEISMSFKRKSLPVTLAALSALASVNASAGFPTLYGKIDLSLNNYALEKNAFPLTAPNATTFKNVGAADTTTELTSSSLESNASRFGIKGDFAVADGLTAVYKVEYGIDVDNGTNSNGRELTQRNVFGGLQSDWGTVLAGKNDTPLKTIQTNSVYQADIDRFNDLPLADIGTYLVGENRADNTIQYVSPILLGGLEINIAAIQGEETGVKVNAINPQNDNRFASGKSISAVYGKSKWYLGIAVDNNVAATDTTRAVGEVTLGSVKLGAIYQTAKRHESFDLIGPFSTFVNSGVATTGAQNGLNPISEWDGVAGSSFKEQKGYVLNAVWKIAGPWSAKIQYGTSTSTPTPTPSATVVTPTPVQYDDVDVHALAVDVDYKLNDNAKLFAYYASLDAKGDARISTQKTVDTTAAIGVDFKF
jgi:predicted porin